MSALTACQAESQAPAAARTDAEPVSEREQVLGAFLSQHWRLPVPLQGEPPSHFSSTESSLDPTRCGACHPKQWHEWQSSFHAKAFSPGFSGQLIEGDLAAPHELRQCQTCHAPLSEQQPVNAALAAEPAFDSALRQQGIVCAACHVRAHARFGPPRRAGLPEIATPVPHAGFEARAEFAESRFCAPCHQFFDDPGINGKPLENTYAEWVVSPAAKAGRTCQNCHMPDRAHLWRGIHDPETVRSGVESALFVHERTPTQIRAALVLQNTGVGHAFPTYVTPRVWLHIWQEDAAGEEIADTRESAVIAREVDLGAWEELWDTRVLPGESVKLDYAATAGARATTLVGRVRVDPDYFYRGVYSTLLTQLTHAEALAKIREALVLIAESEYTLYEFRESIAQ